MSLPMFYGEMLISKVKDFELPFDLVDMYNTTGIAGDTALDEVS